MVGFSGRPENPTFTLDENFAGLICRARWGPSIIIFFSTIYNNITTLKHCNGSNTNIDTDPRHRNGFADLESMPRIADRITMCVTEERDPSSFPLHTPRFASNIPILYIIIIADTTNLMLERKEKRTIA